MNLKNFDMTQEEKQLLLIDLCARLPYDIICEVFDPQQEYEEDVFNAHLIQIDAWTSYCYFWGCSETDPYDIEQVKPYLRPLSSMTEEEKEELKNATCPNGTGYFNEQYLVCPLNHFGEQISFDFMSDIIDWLNAHHFDYRGLIEKGLAIEAPEGMYNTKTE